MKYYWFRCPQCKTLGIVDEEQVNGVTSIQCEQDNKCNFHAKGNVEPKIECEIPLAKKTEFILIPL